MSGEEPKKMSVVNINTPSPGYTLYCAVLLFVVHQPRETWQEQPSLCVVVVRPPWHNLTQSRRSAGRRRLILHKIMNGEDIYIYFLS